MVLDIIAGLFKLWMLGLAATWIVATIAIFVLVMFNQPILAPPLALLFFIFPAILGHFVNLDA